MAKKLIYNERTGKIEEREINHVGIVAALILILLIVIVAVFTFIA